MRTRSPLPTAGRSTDHLSTPPITGSMLAIAGMRSATKPPSHTAAIACRCTKDGSRRCTRYGGTRPYRVHYRDPSFTNLQATAAMCEGGMLADVIAAVASIDPVMGGVDR